MSEVWETKNVKAMAEENWHPASEPPDTDRVVMLRIDHQAGPSASIFIGRYNAHRRYECRENKLLSPHWWKEFPEWCRDE